MTPQEEREALATFAEFERRIRAIRKGDRFVLSQQYQERLKRHAHFGNNTTVPVGVRGTVKTVSISGLSLRLEMTFDGHKRSWWLAFTQLAELDILEKLSEV